MTAASSPSPVAPAAGRSTGTVTAMFDRIARRYDFLNHLLSCGQDFYWRRALAQAAARHAPEQIIDVGTGTADQALALAKHNPQARVIGFDLAAALLAIGRQKVERRGLGKRIELREGDALALPLEPASADLVTMSFVFRNLPDREAALREVRRVLQSDGRLLILEFGLPPAALVRIPYCFYLRHLLPVLGGVVSGDRDAYRYLNATIEAFPCGQTFLDLLSAAGFAQPHCRRLSLGTVYLYEAHG